jgi:hypothetical protein
MYPHKKQSHPKHTTTTTTTTTNKRINNYTFNMSTEQEAVKHSPKALMEMYFVKKKLYS